MYKRSSLKLSKTQMVIAAIVVVVAILIFKRLRTSPEGFGFSDLNPVKVFAPAVDWTKDAAKSTADWTEGAANSTADWSGSAYSWTKDQVSNGRCTVSKMACSTLFDESAIANGGACEKAAAEWVTTCEAAGGGPEDPFADVCAASAFPVEKACSAAMNAGGAFGEKECISVVGC